MNPTTQTLYRNHAAELRAYAQKRLPGAAAVDDVLQEAFLRMHLHLGRLKKPEAARAWAFQILRSSIVDYLRRQRPNVPMGSHVGTESAGADDEIALDLADYVAGLVGELPEPYRRAITLVELHGHTVRKAATLERVTETAMKSRVRRARARLLELTDRCCRVELDARGRVVDCVPRSKTCC